MRYSSFPLLEVFPRSQVVSWKSIQNVLLVDTCWFFLDLEFSLHFNPPACEFRLELFTRFGNNISGMSKPV